MGFVGVTRFWWFLWDGHWILQGEYKVKSLSEGECAEYDAKDRMIPFNGLLLCDVQSDSEEDSEWKGHGCSCFGIDREAFPPQKFGLTYCTLGFFKASLNLTWH